MLVVSLLWLEPAAAQLFAHFILKNLFTLCIPQRSKTSLLCECVNAASGPGSVLVFVLCCAVVAAGPQGPVGPKGDKGAPGPQGEHPVFEKMVHPDCLPLACHCTMTTPCQSLHTLPLLRTVYQGLCAADNRTLLHKDLWFSPHSGIVPALQAWSSRSTVVA